MKPVILVTGLGVGGAEKFITNLAPHIKADVISLLNINDNEKKLREQGIKVTYVSNNKKFYPWHLVKLFSVLKKSKADTLLTFLIHADIVGRIVGRLLGMRVISNIRNDYRDRKLWAFLDKITQSLVYKYTINSKALRSYMRYIGRSATYIPNGINTISKGENLKQKYKIKGKIVLNIGNLKTKKNHNLLIDAFEGIKADLFIIGSGQLEQQIREKIKNKPNIHLLTNYSEASQVMHSVDVFVLPSEREGMSNALLEAMASGLTCVVSDIPQNTQLIEHKTNGLVHKLSKKSLHDTLKQALISDYGKQAAQTIRKHYKMEIVLDQYTQLLR